MNEYNDPKVSVMIPTYNQSSLLHNAIESALNQTYRNLEVVVADDASTDNTKEIVSCYHDVRLKYFCNDKNIGRVRNYHRALYEYATGDWAVNLDGDDYFIDPRFIEDSINALVSHPGAIMVFAGYYQHHADEHLREDAFMAGSDIVTEIDGNTFFFSIPRNKTRLHHLTTIYNRKEAMKIGFYAKDIISADYESLYRLLINHRILYFDRIVGVWLMHGDNISTKNNITAWVDNLDLFPSVYNYAIRKMVPRSKLRINKWLIANFIHYARRIIIRALLCRNPEVIRTVIAGIWKKNRILCTLALLSPRTIATAVYRLRR